MTLTQEFLWALVALTTGFNLGLFAMRYKTDKKVEALKKKLEEAEVQLKKLLGHE